MKLGCSQFQASLAKHIYKNFCRYTSRNQITMLEGTHISTLPDNVKTLSKMVTSIFSPFSNE